MQQLAECQEITHNPEELRDRCGDDNFALTEESNKDHKDHRQTIGQPTQAQVHLAADSFYDDWLHRGFQEPVRHMNYYMYGMYVRRRPVLEAMAQSFTHCPLRSALQSRGGVGARNPLRATGSVPSNRDWFGSLSVKYTFRIATNVIAKF